MTSRDKAPYEIVSREPMNGGATRLTIHVTDPEMIRALEHGPEQSAPGHRVVDPATLPTVTTWGRMAGGGRRRSFQVGTCVVSVEPVHGLIAHDADAERLAAEIARAAAGIEARHEELTSELEAARLALRDTAERLAIAERALPPKRPQRLLAPGCIRVSTGQMWLLGRRDQGWSSFGVQVAGWDDLFRRYAVTITEHGVDEHGMWWEAEPSNERGCIECLKIAIADGDILPPACEACGGPPRARR